MIISGLQKMTLLDYPGKVACTVFLQGCNFRCPFCHNSDLLGNDGPEPISEETLMKFLNKRVGLLDAVCVTGGEPTLQKDLPVLFLSGSDDPVGGYGDGVNKAWKAFEKAGMERSQIKLYPLCRHELLNEINKTEVYDYIFHWLENNS